MIKHYSISGYNNVLWHQLEAGHYVSTDEKWSITRGTNRKWWVKHQGGPWGYREWNTKFMEHEFLPFDTLGEAAGTICEHVWRGLD